MTWSNTCITVFVVSQHAFFGYNVVFQVKKSHEPVFVDQFIVKTSQAFLVPNCKNGIADDESTNGLMASRS